MKALLRLGLTVSIVLSLYHATTSASSCTGDQIQKMINAGFSKQEIMRLCDTTTNRPPAMTDKDPMDSALQTLRAAINSKEGPGFFRKLLGGGTRKTVFHELTTDHFVATFGWLECRGGTIETRYCDEFESKMKARFVDIYEVKFFPSSSLIEGHLCVKTSDVEWLERSRPSYAGVCVVLMWRPGPDVTAVRTAVGTLAGKDLPESK